MSEYNYRFLKLVTGEGILADVQEVDSNTLLLKLPLQVFLDKGQLVLFPFLPVASSDDREIHLSKNHVLFTCSLIPKIKDLMNDYCNQAYAVTQPKTSEANSTPKSPEDIDLSDLFKRLNDDINKGKKPS